MTEGKDLKQASPIALRENPKGAWERLRYILSSHPRQAVVVAILFLGSIALLFDPPPAPSPGGVQGLKLPVPSRPEVPSSRVQDAQPVSSLAYVIGAGRPERLSKKRREGGARREKTDWEGTKGLRSAHSGYSGDEDYSSEEDYSSTHANAEELSEPAASAEGKKTAGGGSRLGNLTGGFGDNGSGGAAAPQGGFSPLEPVRDAVAATEEGMVASPTLKSGTQSRGAITLTGRISPSRLAGADRGRHGQQAAGKTQGKLPAGNVASRGFRAEQAGSKGSKSGSGGSFGAISPGGIAPGGGIFVGGLGLRADGGSGTGSGGGTPVQGGSSEGSSATGGSGEGQEGTPGEDPASLPEEGEGASGQDWEEAPDGEAEESDWETGRGLSGRNHAEFGRPVRGEAPDELPGEEGVEGTAPADNAPEEEPAPPVQAGPRSGSLAVRQMNPVLDSTVLVAALAPAGGPLLGPRSGQHLGLRSPLAPGKPAYGVEEPPPSRDSAARSGTVRTRRASFGDGPDIALAAPPTSALTQLEAAESASAKAQELPADSAADAAGATMFDMGQLSVKGSEDPVFTEESVPSEDRGGGRPRRRTPVFREPRAKEAFLREGGAGPKGETAEPGGPGLWLAGLPTHAAQDGYGAGYPPALILRQSANSRPWSLLRSRSRRAAPAAQRAGPDAGSSLDGDFAAAQGEGIARLKPRRALAEHESSLRGVPPRRTGLGPVRVPRATRGPDADRAKLLLRMAAITLLGVAGALTGIWVKRRKRERMRERGQIILPVMFVLPCLMLFAFLLSETARISREKIRHQFALDSAAFIEAMNHSNLLNRLAYINGAFPHRVFKEELEWRAVEMVRSTKWANLHPILYANGAFPSWQEPPDPDAEPVWKIRFRPAPRGRDGGRADMEGGSHAPPQLPPMLELTTHQDALDYWIAGPPLPSNIKHNYRDLIRDLYWHVYARLGRLAHSQHSLFRRFAERHSFFVTSYRLNTLGSPDGDRPPAQAAASFDDHPFDVSFLCIEGIQIHWRYATGNAFDPVRIHHYDRTKASKPHPKVCHVIPHNAMRMPESRACRGMGLFQLAWIGESDLKPWSAGSPYPGHRIAHSWGTGKTFENYFKADLTTLKPEVRATVSVDGGKLWPDPTPKFQVRLYP